MTYSILTSVNQSKQVYIAPCVASESEARNGRHKAVFPLRLRVALRGER